MEQDRKEGCAEKAREMLLLVGETKFGPPDDATRYALESVRDLAQLEELMGRLLRFGSWEELLRESRMYERFSDQARKVMNLANQEAQRLNHEYVGPEHILLGLVKEGSGVAVNVLKNLDVDLRKIRVEIQKMVQSGPDMVFMGKLPQTPQAKKVLEYSIEEAGNLNQNYVDTEHFLLGLLREQEGVAAQVLQNLSLKLESVRQEVLSLLGHPDAIVDRSKISLAEQPLKELNLSPKALEIVGFLDKKIVEVQQQKEQTVAKKDFDKAARLQYEERMLQETRQFIISSASVKWRRF